MSAAGRWTRAPGVVARRVAGELVLVPVDRGGAAAPAAPPGSFFVLNETAEVLWEALASPRDVDELARHLNAQFEVDLETARLDVRACLDRLVAAGAVRADQESS